MTSKPESARQFLNNTIFQDIHRRIAFHTELLRRIKQAVPAPMASHCLYCVAREDNSLVLYTDSQAFASNLRFLAPAILTKLNAPGDLTIMHMQIRNLNLTSPTAVEKPVTPMNKPSAETIEMVKASSLCAADDELSAALARLGDTMERYAAK